MDVIREFWVIIAACVTGLGFVYRTEAKALQNAREIERLWTQRKEDLQSAKDSRDRMDTRLDEISADIKAILRSIKN